MQSLHAIAAALLLGGALAAQAADRDAMFQPGELLSSNSEYREAWQDMIEDEKRLPDWLINLSGPSTALQAVEGEDGSLRWLGEPDDDMRKLLEEQLRSDPNWF